MRLLRLGTKTPVVRQTSVAIATLGIITLAQLPMSPAHAQLLDQLKGAVGAGSGAGAGTGLGGGIPAVDQANPSNTAGVLQYCIRNNYVAGGSAASVKDSVVSKFSGSDKETQDSSFQSGNNGTLQTGTGQGFSLGGSGVKEQVTRKVCDLVLQHAKSLL